MLFTKNIHVKIDQYNRNKKAFCTNLYSFILIQRNTTNGKQKYSEVCNSDANGSLGTYTHYKDEIILSLFELLPTSQAFWKTRRPDEAADYRAVRRFVCAEKISQTLQNVEM